jgi:hypothetical protein
MASKKKTESQKVEDEFDFGDMDDMEAMNFEDEDGIDSDDRTPSRTKVAGELAKEAGEGFFEGLITQSAKNVLPPEYESGYYDAAELADYGKDVIDKNKQKVNKSVFRLGKEVRKILPFKIGLLERFLEEKESDFETQRQQSEDQMREGAIAGELASIFDKQLEVQTHLAARSEAKGEVEQKERIVQTKMSMDVMTSIDRAVSKQEAFATQITKAYYKKSLELQFKSYFVQADTLKTMKDHYKAFTLQFTNIEKNTSLPDFVKLRNTERLTEMLRDDTTRGVYEQIFTNSKFLQNFKKKTSKFIEDKVSGVTDTMDGMTDMLGNLSDAGGSPTRLLMGAGASMAGTTLGERFANRIPESVREKFKNNAAIKAGGNYMGMLSRSPATLFRTIQQSLKNKTEELETDDTMSGTLLKKVTGGLSSMFETITPETPDLQIKQKGYLQHNQPAIFDNNVHRSITEVIPMYLAKLLQKSTHMNAMYAKANLGATRGMQESDSLMYDFNKRKLDTAANITDNIEKSIFANKATEQKSRQNAGTILQLSRKTVLEGTGDDKAKKKASKIFSDKKNQDLLGQYLDKAKKKLGDGNATYQNLIEEYEGNEDLKKMVTEIPGLKDLLGEIKAASPTNTALINADIEDTMRKYPLEGVKQLFLMASRIAGTLPTNLIKNDVAEIFAKAFSVYILVTGQDLVVQDVVSQIAFKYVTQKDFEKPEIKDAIMVFVADVKKIAKLNEYGSSSALGVVFAAMNTSLKQSVDITPEAYRNLADLYPELVREGKLGIEQIAEGKLFKGNVDTFVNLQELKTATRGTADDVNVARRKTNLEGLLDNAIKRTTTFGTDAIKALRETGGDPFKVAQLALKTAAQAKTSATDLLEETSTKLKNKSNELLTQIGTAGDSLSASAVTAAINKLNDYNNTITERVRALEVDLVEKDRQLSEAMAIVESATGRSTDSRLILAQAKSYKKLTEANIKVLKQTQTEIVALMKELRNIGEAMVQGQTASAAIAVFRQKVKTTMDAIKAKIEIYEAEIRRHATLGQPAA